MQSGHPQRRQSRQPTARSRHSLMRRDPLPPPVPPYLPECAGHAITGLSLRITLSFHRVHFLTVFRFLPVSGCFRHIPPCRAQTPGSAMMTGFARAGQTGGCSRYQDRMKPPAALLLLVLFRRTTSPRTTRSRDPASSRPCRRRTGPGCRPPRSASDIWPVCSPVGVRRAGAGARRCRLRAADC